MARKVQCWEGGEKFERGEIERCPRCGHHVCTDHKEAHKANCVSVDESEEDDQLIEEVTFSLERDLQKPCGKILVNWRPD
jgi:hypothetical protein